MIRHIYKTAIKKDFYGDQSGTYEVGPNHLSFNANKITTILWMPKMQERNSDVSYVKKDVYYQLYLVTFDNGQKEYICVPNEEDFISTVWPEVTR
tara:strand:- start:369 stop:653 length:285 start_codon:yes stop_codon:yes gene_type:complete